MCWSRPIQDHYDNEQKSLYLDIFTNSFKNISIFKWIEHPTVSAKVTVLYWEILKSFPYIHIIFLMNI